MKKRPGFMFYLEWSSFLETLTDQEFTALLRAMFDYCAHGVTPRFDDRLLQALWSMVQPRLDADARRYQQTVQARRDAANRRWNREPPRHADMTETSPD